MSWYFLWCSQKNDEALFCVLMYPSGIHVVISIPIKLPPFAVLVGHGRAMVSKTWLSLVVKMHSRL